MKTKAAVTWGIGEPFSIEEVDLAEPKDDEILVKIPPPTACAVEEGACNCHVLITDLQSSHFFRLSYSDRRGVTSAPFDWYPRSGGMLLSVCTRYC